MRIILCDYCKQQVHGDHPISLRGVCESRGGILLPEQFHQRDFCSKGCLANWTGENVRMDTCADLAKTLGTIHE